MSCRILRGASALVGLALLAGCAAAPPVVAPAAPAAAPASAAPDPAPVKPEPLPVTPVPVPPIVVVQSAPSTPPPQQTAPAQQVSDEELQALGLLAELQHYVVEAGEDLKRELAAANAALARTRSDANRIRVAMLLTLPAAGLPDDARALSLLDPIVGRTGNASAMKQIAALLYAQITERSRTVREEQRRTAAAQEKLDALRAVERTLLLERGRNAGGGAGGGGGGTGR